MLKNIITYALNQGANLIIPLITLPYVTHVLGIKVYGQVAFSTYLSALIFMFVDYVFMWTVNKKISSNRNNYETIQKTISLTLSSQLSIWIIATIGLFCINGYFELIPITFLIAATMGTFGASISTLWFYQGIEKAFIANRAQFWPRLASIPLIFLLVKKPDDAPHLIIINSCCIFFTNLFLLGYVKTKYKYYIKITSLHNQYKYLMESIGLFRTRLAQYIFTGGIPIILGIICPPEAVALFSIADKIRNIGQSATHSVSVALYPKLSYLFQFDVKLAKYYLTRFSLLMFGLACISTFTLINFSQIIINTVLGESYSDASYFLKILSLTIPIITLNNILGWQYLLNTGHPKFFSQGIICGAMVGALLAIPLIMKYDVFGGILSILISETVCLLSFIYFIKKVVSESKNQKK